MKKKKTNPIIRVLELLFVVFIALFIASKSGYYESKMRDKVVITESGIKDFEAKVQNGEEIDITSFLNKERTDYRSPMSNLGDNLTSTIEVAMEKGAKIVGDILKSLF